MIKFFESSKTGKTYKWPIGKAEATILKRPQYTDEGNICEVCHLRNPYRYVADDQCYECVWKSEFEQLGQRNEQICYSIKEAIEAGQPGYYGWDYRENLGKGVRLCDKSAHPFYRCVASGRCLLCDHYKKIDREKISPRQIARQNSLEFYTPNNKCKKCSTRKYRRVDTDDCTGCNPPPVADPQTAQNRPSIESQTWTGKRADAAGLGFKYYSDGRPCKAAHIGPRYVKSGGCLQCLGIH